MVEVAAGEPWDEVVERAIEEEWSGLEALSGIPGSTGATPLQNVGAYGQEVAQTIARVRLLDRSDGTIRTVAAADCGFAYRSSAFRHDPRWVVLAVTFQLRLGGQGAPIRYAELARRLGVAEGARAPSRDVRAAVLELRRSKGMVLDPSDHDTWSAGSFFINPILDAEAAARLPPDAPRYPVDGGDQDLGGLADRAGRLPAGLGRGRGPRLHQAHARPDQPRRRLDGRGARAGPDDQGRASRTGSASSSSRSPCSSAARL